MGAYLCIAQNSVPPSVSKRIKVSVDCKYNINKNFNKNESSLEKKCGKAENVSKKIIFVSIQYGWPRPKFDTLLNYVCKYTLKNFGCLHIF